MSHNGDLNQNIFVTADLNVDKTFENFIHINNDIKITTFQKDKNKLIFKKTTKNYPHEKIFYYCQEIIKLNFKNLLNKINKEKDNHQSVPRKALQKNQEIENLKNQLNQTHLHIQNLEAQLNTIKSAKFFKLWQTYCSIMKILGLKKS